MRTQQSSLDINSGDRSSGLPTNPDRSALLVAVVVGAVLGIGVGFFSMAGWPGMILGLLVGALAGGLIGKHTLARSHRKAAEDRSFDRETGVIP